MFTKLHYLIKLKHQFLAIMPRPRGEDWLEGEIQHLSQLGLHTLVSLLEKEEIKELKLDQEEKLCINFGMNYMNYPIKDRGIPENYQECIKFLKELHTIFLNGHSICIHCRMGIGRSSIIAAALILMDQKLKVPKILEIIKERRGLTIPDTKDQVEWLFEIQKHINSSIL